MQRLNRATHYTALAELAKCNGVLVWCVLRLFQWRRRETTAVLQLLVAPLSSAHARCTVCVGVPVHTGTHPPPEAEGSPHLKCRSLLFVVFAALSPGVVIAWHPVNFLQSAASVLDRVMSCQPCSPGLAGKRNATCKPALPAGGSVTGNESPLQQLLKAGKITHLCLLQTRLFIEGEL